MVRYAFPKEPSGCRVCWRRPSRCECTGKEALPWSREVELPKVVNRLGVGGMKERGVSRTSPGFGAWHLEGGCQLQ